MPGSRNAGSVSNSDGQGRRAGWNGAPDGFLTRATAALLITFLLVFPKGGIKVAGVPITWGYLALGGVFLSIPVVLRSGASLVLPRSRLAVLGALLPFQLISLTSFLFNGIDNSGFAISFIVSVFFLPAIFVLVLGPHVDRMDLRFVLRGVRLGMSAVAAYGIFLFIYKFLTGSFLEIPLLTVNAGDLGQLEGKYIDRGGVFKLISTYNNGNIYGISLLILLPLYTAMERSTARRTIVKVSLLLTLSRTVWIGLVLHEVLQRVYVRRVSLRSLSLLGTSLGLVLAGVWFALDLLGQDVSFLFDRTLGGRQAQWRDLHQVTLLPSIQFSTIAEIVYLSVLRSFGLVGLGMFTIGLAGPLLLHVFRAVPFWSTPYKRCLAAGLAIYMVLAAGDGAFLYIPVMAVYWFVVTLLLSPNPTPLSALAEPESAMRKPLLRRVIDRSDTREHARQG